MKSIAIVAHQAFALINFRQSLIVQLIGRGHKVFALAPDFTEAQIVTVRRLGAIPIPYGLSRAGVNPLKDFRDTLSLAYLLKKLKVDIFFGFAIKPVIFGSFAAWMAHIPHRVAMIEGLGYLFTNDNQKNSFKKSLLFRVATWLYRIGLSRANTVIFLNQDDIAYFIEQKLVSAAKAINLDGIGIDLEAWKMSPPVLSPVTFIMVARLLKEKGVLEYLSAAKQLRDKGLEARVILLGDIDSNPGSISTSFIAEQTLLSGVEWFGHVDVKPWLHKSSVFVLPSYREGVPRSTLEAMSVGRPVITTDVPGCRETVVNGVNGYLIPPFDGRALATAMSHFIREPHLIKQMGDESRKIVERRFNVVDKDDFLIKLLGVEEDQSQSKAIALPTRGKLFLSLNLKRAVDLFLSLIAGIIWFIPGLVVAILIKLTSPGPVLYWSSRIGKDNQPFLMPKFRSMRVDAPVIPTHLMANQAHKFLTPMGSFLRKSSLDELPQLWSIFIGDMSFVGPRPALFNQDDLILGRKALGVDALKPGLTGWAQVNGRDEIELEKKLQYDQEYLFRQSFWFDVYVIWLTFLKVIRRDGVSH